jgi:hypothetical protein
MYSAFVEHKLLALAGNLYRTVFFHVRPDGLSPQADLLAPPGVPRLGEICIDGRVSRGAFSSRN